MKLHILGCFSATPRGFGRTTSQVLEINNEMVLIDCGEGSQVALRKHKIKFARINHIFISHLHGDHFFGLIGLISTFTLLNRVNDLHIYGPKGIKEIILLQLKLSKTYTSYNLFFHELESEESEIILENDKITVRTIPLIHRVYTNGYLFTEKPGKRKLNLTACDKYKVDTCYFNKIKEGGDFVTEQGEVIHNSELTFDADPAKSYAFCSDTVYTETIVPIIKNATVLYHESTFLEEDADRCEHTKHSTAKQAAKIAQMAEVNHLILGHYSTRYHDLSLFKTEAQEIFEPTELAEDGKVFKF
ncbi:ribonuclease Z [Capnocytophaga sp. ARDL2]|uniref:ribonuclease Z n=1 Tax=Capnocytophaga sp. ARDL2 TaxID=3238809 RepID=UPI003558B692